MQETKINVRLAGTADIMFDRFIDHSTEPRPAEQKFYLAEGNQVVLPGNNVLQFLFAEEKPYGCARRFEGKEGSKYAQTGQAFCFINNSMINFLDDKGPVIFRGFEGSKQFRIHLEAAVTKMSNGKVIKQEARPRPVLMLPWSLKFEISLIKNDKIDPDKLFNWFSAGGMMIGLGTHRPQFGRFVIDEWE